MTEFSKRFKDPQVWGFFVSVAMMALLAIVFFYPDNFEGNTLMQSDIQQGLANGHEGQAYESATGEKALWTNSLFWRHAHVPEFRRAIRRTRCLFGSTRCTALGCRRRRTCCS